MEHRKYETGQPITVLASCELFSPSIKNPSTYKLTEKPTLGWFVDGDESIAIIVTTDDNRYWETDLGSIRTYVEKK